MQVTTSGKAPHNEQSCAPQQSDELPPTLLLLRNLFPEPRLAAALREFALRSL
jgi:hypothetical protein